MSERKPGTRAGISFRLTSEQRELQRLAHEFAERELRPIAAEWDEREAYPSDLLAKAAGVGLTSYAIPAAHGGGGADAVTCALIAEELSWGCAGLASTIRAEARREGDAYVLSGENVYFTNGGIADLTLVFAKRDGEITAFLVERDDP